jgi:hypothetical protein
VAQPGSIVGTLGREIRYVAIGIYSDDTETLLSEVTITEHLTYISGQRTTPSSGNGFFLDVLSVGNGGPFSLEQRFSVYYQGVTYSADIQNRNRETAPFNNISAERRRVTINGDSNYLRGEPKRCR